MVKVNPDKDIVKLYLWKIEFASEKKCKSVIISLISAHFERKKNTVTTLIPQAI